MDYKALERRIEALRAKMHAIYLNNPNSSQLLEISQSLDELLNKLENIKWDKS